jgi:colicin import membrane protein
VIAVLLLVSFNFNTDQPAFSAAKPKAEPIQATAVSEADFREQMQAIEERENRKKQERLEAERKVAELREKQKQEQEKLVRIKEEQERLKKKEAEEKRAAELAAKKKEEERKKAEQARKKKEEERKKAELAKKKKEEERKKAELAAKKKREEEERQKQLALQRQLEAERRARAVASALNQYIPIITQKVSRNWNRPSNLRSGITAGVAVRLTPSGEVVSAELIRSSGNPVFDRSVVNAVLKASPLPIPRERGVNEEFRNLNLTFNPEDLI